MLSGQESTGSAMLTGFAQIKMQSSQIDMGDPAAQEG
eukprot:COSAG05_NODE_20257_length_281_cov_0.571429_1_plen_36_part_10